MEFAAKHESVALSRSDRTACLHLQKSNSTSKVGRTVQTAPQPGSGTYRWTIRIDNDGDGPITIGISQAAGGKDAKLTSPTWCYNSRGVLETTSANSAAGLRRVNSQTAKLSKEDNKGGVKCLAEDTTYGKPYRTGDVVGVELQMRSTSGPTLRFFYNFEDLGVAFTGLPKEGLCLGVSLFTDKQCVTLLSGDRTSASQNNWSDTPLPVPTLVQQELNKVSQDTEEAFKNTEKEVKEYFDDLRKQLQAHEDRVLQTLSKEWVRDMDSVRRQQALLASGSAQTEGAGAENGSSKDVVVPCPLEPVVDVAALQERLAAFKAREQYALLTKAQKDEIEAQSDSFQKLTDELEKVKGRLRDKTKRLEDKQLLFKKANPVVPTDFVPVPANTPGMSTFRLDASSCAATGWVDQTSPACAAAVVAGALNSILNSSAARKQKVRLKQDDVLEIYEQMWTADLHSARQGLLNELDLKHLDSRATTQLEELMSVVEAELKAKEAAGGPPVDRRGEQEPSGDGDEDEEADGETPSTAVAATPANKEKPTRSGTLIIVREVLSRLPPNHGDPLLQRLVTYNSQGWLEPGATKEGANLPADGTWRVHDARRQVSAKLGALRAKKHAMGKLQQERPSTAPVGNDRLTLAATQLAEAHGSKVRMWRFMAGGGGGTEVILSPNDNADKVTSQWQALRALVVRQQTVLVYHLENHYCLVFACREWTAGGGYNGTRQVRQILAARPGQQPSNWIDFDVVRSTLTGWNGYCIMALCSVSQAIAM